MTTEEKIKKTWRDLKIPYFTDHDGCDKPWPFYGPPSIRSYPAVSFDDFDYDSVINTAVSVVTFTYKIVMHPKWSRHRYVIYGELDGVKIPVVGAEYDTV